MLAAIGLAVGGITLLQFARQDGDAVRSASLLGNLFILGAVFCEATCSTASCANNPAGIATATSQQQVYVLAQQRIQAAASHSPLLAQARTNTRNMLTGMLHALGFKRVTVIFAPGS